VVPSDPRSEKIAQEGNEGHDQNELRWAIERKSAVEMKKERVLQRYPGIGEKTRKGNVDPVIGSETPIRLEVE
jgi:hypothetical protein